MSQLNLFNSPQLEKSKKIKIGVVGFSRNQFDKADAQRKLKAVLAFLTKENDPQSFELVSGYTASGVPKIAYILADELGIETVGFSVKQATKVKSGVYPVKKTIIVGEKFGDESNAFIAYIDLLIRIGGGQQSRQEVELFKKLHEGKDLSRILFEEEVNWFGN